MERSHHVNPVLVRFLHGGKGKRRWFFAVNGHDVHFKYQSQVGHKDMGELLLVSASLDPHTAVGVGNHC